MNRCVFLTDDIILTPYSIFVILLFIVSFFELVQNSYDVNSLSIIIYSHHHFFDFVQKNDDDIFI